MRSSFVRTWIEAHPKRQDSNPNLAGTLPVLSAPIPRTCRYGSKRYGSKERLQTLLAQMGGTCHYG